MRHACSSRVGDVVRKMCLRGAFTLDGDSIPGDKCDELYVMPCMREDFYHVSMVPLEEISHSSFAPTLFMIVLQVSFAAFTSSVWHESADERVKCERNVVLFLYGSKE
jgi:hypothetical protein